MLYSEHIKVRAVRESDLDNMIALAEEIEQQGPFLPYAMVSAAQIRKDFHKDGFISDSFTKYLITDLADNLLGTVWAFKSIPYFDALEVGYQIYRPKNRGKGYASAALKLLCQYLFDARQVNRLEIRVAKDNLASQKVAKKCGFQQEGLHPQAAFSKGKLHDMYSYGLLRANRPKQP